MSVLVLHHRGSLRGTPYDRWLADYDGDVLLLGSRRHLDLVGEDLPGAGSGYRHVEALDGYEAGGTVEPRAVDLAREHGVRHIIACQEQDLERAARLRELLGLPGQRLPSTIPYRNKLVMKDMARAAGIPVAPYAAVECAADVIAFAGERGFPIVVKPRDSAGSIGVKVIGSQEELDRYLAEDAGLHGPFQPNLLVESYVPGAMCHVDGLVVDGRVVFAWPSQYLFALSTFKEDTGGRLDVTLDPDDPLSRRLLELADRVLAALPGPRHFAFHAEVFHTPDDRLVLCEIACRNGGASIRDIMRALFGADPTECWVRAQLGLPLPIDTAGPRLRPSTMAGQLVLVKRAGRVVAVPQERPFPWVEKYNIFVRPGQVMNGPAFSADFLASFVVTGPDRRTCESRMRQVEAWFLGGLVIEPLTGDGPSGPARRPAGGEGTDAR
ncbi:ATP-grasp domain-containing protein [Streptosporangium sp. CA-135522]|uniref:ATP-grasp domain-containing protein n=1 Tax=Streptosporangium sp. CA-135522 TaxID=3240072 RepID=UPI003D8BC384